MDVLRAENISLKSELELEKQLHETLDSKLKVYSKLVQVASAEKEATEATISTSDSSNSPSQSNELTQQDAEHSTVGTHVDTAVDTTTVDATVDTAVNHKQNDQDVEQAVSIISEFATTIDSSISHIHSTASEVVMDTETANNHSNKRKLSHDNEVTAPENVPSHEFLFTDMEQVNADDSPLPALEPAKPAPATKKRKVPLPLWFLKDQRSGNSAKQTTTAAMETETETGQEQEQEQLAVSPALQHLRHVTPSKWTIKEITVLYTLVTTKLGFRAYSWLDLATEMGVLVNDCRTKWTQLKSDLKLEKGEYLTPLTHSQAVVIDTQLQSCETYDELGKAVTWTILANEFCCSELQLRIRLQLYLNKQREKFKAN